MVEGKAGRDDERAKGRRNGEASTVMMVGLTAEKAVIGKKIKNDRPS
jgi:hypothetical protein